MAELADTLTATDDDRLDQAEAAVRGYCRWHIAPSRSESVTLQPSHSPVLMLPSLHVAAVASVTEDGVTLDAASYNLDGRGWLTRTWGNWSTGPVVVSMTHGHADIPADVTGVVQAVAQRAIDGTAGAASWSRTDGPFASSANYGSSANGKFLPSELGTLDRYKLPPRP